jgi:hypothetical protein
VDAVRGRRDAVLGVQARRAADDNEVERPKIEQAVERVAGCSAVLRGQTFGVRTRRRVDPGDRDAWNGRRRPRVCFADVAGANKPDANRQPFT